MASNYLWPTAAFVALLLLSACGSSPEAHFYALSPTEAQIKSPAPSAPIQVAAVHIPPMLDRREMVTMTGENGVNIDEQNRWAADFGEMARGALAEDLAARFPGGAIVFPDAPTTDDMKALVVNISDFEVDASGRAILKAAWTLLRRQDAKTLLSGDADLAVAAAPGPAGQAAAMSKLLGELADKIAARLSAAPPPERNPSGAVD